ncbi:serine/threonine-protein kinase [Streptomyces triticirhizae]|uniref:non-specific serine/threonine protein kinase n=1 Tax=Streptomyces triticirhizae TaxID=2483353 RepID=A0A3M2LDI9_9ACTN|nr:serine/threonine-protein kinase [Streptomyces triticirhizae]RMI34673.1 serine/threonine protein kinase [Streptomyces triticirhizae]
MSPTAHEETGRPCQRPGCDGRYRLAERGQLYCDACGLAPVVSAEGIIGDTRTRPTSPRLGEGPDSEGSSGSGSGRSSRSRASRRSVSGRLALGETGPPTGPLITVRGKRAAAPARSRLGAGLVAMPRVPRPDPRKAVLKNPEVPERKRFCGNNECGARVGRSRQGRPGRTEGYCTKCGHPYSFVPKLRPGDLVKDQYRITGCIAHGGLGWIYLAVDTAVSDRWVVLKGLLDTGDEDAMAAAISERRFLAEIEHSSIVRIYNFVEHLDPRTGSLDGYIVMEYVGGQSLKQIANARRTPEDRRDPLPVEHACAYGIDALEALGYLHGRNLLYCDFKVDNAIQQDDQLKLIDLGAVRRMGDVDSPVYSTVGYQAPELAERGASVASDLYTVARTLAVLTFDFQGYTSVYADSLPDPEHIEVFQRHESFYRFLVRATDPDPEARFASAEEMAEQLTGVLREIVAERSGRPQPAVSQLFAPEARVVDTEPLPAPRDGVSRLGARPGGRRRGRKRAAEAHPAGPPATASRPAGPPAPAVVPPNLRDIALALPLPLVDPDDPNAGFLAGLMASAPAEQLVALRQASTDSVERRLREVRAHLELADPASWVAARAVLAELRQRHAGDWRIVWHQGLASLVEGDLATAAGAFDAVYDAFPGEIAPKLALAVCAEWLGQLDNAADYYALVWACDPSHVSAAFGLARVRLAAGDRAGAVAALESVPETSAHHTAARVAAVRARLRPGALGEDTLPDLLAAGHQVALLRAAGLEPSLSEQLSCEVLGRALDWLLSGDADQPGRARPQLRLLDTPLDETGVRQGLDRSYRRLARLAPTSSERTELVEAANRLRPRTWV